MTGFINYLINGISLGSVYAIIALGYTMVYGIAKMLNLAISSWSEATWSLSRHTVWECRSS